MTLDAKQQCPYCGRDFYLEEDHDVQPGCPCPSDDCPSNCLGIDEWSGSPCPLDPDNFWINDATGERIPA